MKVYALRDFYNEAGKNGVGNDDLCDAIKRAEDGLVDATLGRFLIKQRIAHAGQGKARGLRSIVFYKKENIAVFLHVFAKSAKANLTTIELATYKDLVDVLEGLGEAKRNKLVENRKWVELDYAKHGQKVSERSAPVGSPGGKGPARG